MGLGAVGWGEGVGRAHQSLELYSLALGRVRASRVGAALMVVVAREKARKALMMEAYMLNVGSGDDGAP